MSQKRFATTLLVLGDIAALYTALGTTLFVRYGTNLTEPWEIHRLPFAVVFFVWILLFFIAGLYEQEVWNANRTVKERILRTIVAAGIVSIVLFYSIPAFVITPKTTLLIQITLSIGIIIGWRMLASLLIRSTSKTNVLFLGTSEEVVSLANTLTHTPHLGYRVIALIHMEHDPPCPEHTIPCIPFTNQLASYIKERGVSLVIASREIRSNRELVRILYDVLPLGIHFMDFATFYETLTGKIPVSLISEVWFLENLAGSQKRVYRILKRVFDVLLALMVGTIGIFLFPIIAFGILLSTPYDVFHTRVKRARPGDGILFFRQERVGKNETIFNFIKFRSQRLGAEHMSEAKEMKNDPRQYPFGKFLRTFYMDELPQIWNVLKGEMSFIGPRPERPTHVAELAKSLPFYKTRLLVPPGITGWAQISMKNDASVEDAPEKLQHDLYYIKNRSLALDLNIALKTLWVILSREGR